MHTRTYSSEDVQPKRSPRMSRHRRRNGFRIGPERRRRNQRISRSVSIVQAICTYNIGGRPLVLCIRRRHIIRYIYAITTS